jgi:hypothetical protein
VIIVFVSYIFVVVIINTKIDRVTIDSHLLEFI